MVRPTGDALQRSAHRGGEEPSHRGEGCAAPRRAALFLLSSPETVRLYEATGRG